MVKSMDEDEFRLWRSLDDATARRQIERIARLSLEIVIHRLERAQGKEGYIIEA